MIKEHDQQAKIKATPRKLAYANSNKEAPARSLAKGFSDRFSLESSGTSDTYRQTRSTSKSQKTPSKNNEPTHLRRSKRLEDQSTTKEKARRERSKSRRKSSRYQEISSDFEHEEGSEDAYEDLNSPYKRSKPTPFTQRITRLKYHQRAKLPRNIRVYEGNKDPEDHLGIFSAVAEQEKWPMPVWCKIFCQTLGGAARNWVDNLNPKSVDNFEELSQKLLEEFSQQKRYAKDPTEIHSIKRRQNEGLGHNTNDCYQLKKQIEEAVASGKLAHLVTDIRQNNQWNGNQGRNDKPIILEGIIEGNQVRRILVDGGSSSEIMYEHCFRNLDINIRSRLRRCKALMIGRTGLRSLRAIGSTIHFMIKFPTDQGVVIMETSRETLRECKHLERLQGTLKEVQWRQREEKMSRIREQVILRARSNSERRPSLGLVSLEKTQRKEDVEEVFTISHERLNQYVTMGATLTTNYKQLLVDILRENIEVFAWAGSKSTTIP
ncbi:reverse transcriptase domain-containing protein [Tanacetum coccineum]